MTNALVLGGGGVTGIAWELGVLHGLAEHGIDLTSADTLIGTSAGSVVGSQVTSGLRLPELYDRQLAPADSEIGATFGTSTMLRIGLPMLLPGSRATRRRRLGRVALRAQPGSADARLHVIGSRIGVTAWPDRDLRITAVNAVTGRSAVFTRDSGVDLVTAIAASCAVPIVWPPVPINGVPHIDGGMRSVTNADLAVGASRVVVLAPVTRSPSRHYSIAAQLERLGPGTRTLVLSPDKQVLAAIGKNMLDPAKRADAAAAGRRQVDTFVEQVRKVWEPVH